MGKKAFLRSMALLVLAVSIPAALAAQEPGLTERLTALAKMWGFLKYYDNGVSGSEVDWDQVLIENLPRVKQAGTKDAFNHVLLMMIRAAGMQNQARNVNMPVKETDLAWMDDARLFLPITSALLNEVYLSHQFLANEYAKATEGTGEAYFPREKEYEDMADPAEEYRLLGLFRYWNIVRYFYPYRNLMKRDWNQVLETFIPRVMAAATRLDYSLAILEMAALINDSHGAATSDEIRRFWGEYLAPFKPRWVEGKMVVVKTYPALLAGADIRAGDIVTAVNGIPVDTLRLEKYKYIRGSNEAFREQFLCAYLLRSPAQAMALTLERSGARLDINVACSPISLVDEEELASLAARDKYSLFPGNIGYIDLNLLETSDVAAAFALVGNAQAIIFDMRCVPNGTLYELSKYLYPRSFNFARPIIPDLRFPGLFMFGLPYFTAGPAAENPGYCKGRVILVVNEDTYSQGEFTTQALKAVPGAVVIGSQTAGAGGNVSKLTIPGNIVLAFTGTGGLFFDNSQIQGAGVGIDIVVQPTVAGIQAGRDEWLDRAFEYARTGR